MRPHYPLAPGYKALGPSSEAATRITTRAASVRDRVRDFLKAEYPKSFTADEIAARLDVSFLTVRPRCSELHKRGEIEPAGTRGLNESGMSANLWRARVVVPVADQGRLF